MEKTQQKKFWDEGYQAGYRAGARCTLPLRPDLQAYRHAIFVVLEQYVPDSVPLGVIDESDLLLDALKTTLDQLVSRLQKLEQENATQRARLEEQDRLIYTLQSRLDSTARGKRVAEKG